MIDDTRMRWAGAQRCPTCAMPYTAAGINSHLRLDPVTKKRCCPMAHKSDAQRITITTEDEAYIRGLTPDAVYIQKMSSMPNLSNDARAVGTILSPLFTACIESPQDAYKHTDFYT